MCQLDGDCVIPICADFQDPVEMIPLFIRKWEEGAKIVSAIKTASKENRFVRFLRSIYYKMIKKMSDVEQIEHFTGFGLYDKSFIDVMRNLHDPTLFIRGIVAELGFRRVEVSYTQPKRKAGKTHNNWYTLFDAAMLSFTPSTKVGLLFATIGGFIAAVLSLIAAVVYFILKFLHWNTFVAGMAPLVIGMFFFNALQLFFYRLFGRVHYEYQSRIMNHPIVIEEERINFELIESK